MRLFSLMLVATAFLASTAIAQTAGTVFPNNQEPSSTPAQQSMQQVGGPSDQSGVVVQNPPPKDAKTASATKTQTSTTQTERHTKADAKSSGPTPH